MSSLLERGTSLDADSSRMSGLPALDELFTEARHYRSGQEFRRLLDFVQRFRKYAPFNGLLLNVQMPGASFVAPAYRWRNEWQRRIRPGARPLVILQPMGPVMFVFDVSQTEPIDPDAPSIPAEVEVPFATIGQPIDTVLSRTIENARRDGVRTSETKAGAQHAGSIAVVGGGGVQDVLVRERPERQWKSIPIRFNLLCNDRLDARSKYATIVHELAHLYCGHLGTPNKRWWPDRRDLPQDVEEFEAESAAWIVCTRQGLRPSSARYLALYLDSDRDIPAISLELVLKVAGLIEQMGQSRLPLRKERTT